VIVTSLHSYVILLKMHCKLAWKKKRYYFFYYFIHHTFWSFSLFKDLSHGWM